MEAHGIHRVGVERRPSNPRQSIERLEQAELIRSQHGWIWIDRSDSARDHDLRVMSFDRNFVGHLMVLQPITK